MSKQPKATSPYASALLPAIVQYAIMGVLASMILDGGFIGQIFGLALAAHWGGIILIRFRRSIPTKSDLIFIRVGFMILLIIALALSMGIWHLQGKL